MIRAVLIANKDKSSIAQNYFPVQNAAIRTAVSYAECQELNGSESPSLGAATMNCHQMSVAVGLATSLLFLYGDGRASEPTFDRKEDVIYGRKFGTALTMDVFTPKKDSKGIGVIIVVSGGFVSSHDSISPAFVTPLTNRGYTVFTVVHGSQPRYTIPEIIQDMNRAVRFIRYHAKEYGIDSDRIGVTGASAGGHLSLMLGTAGDQGDPNAKDPVDRASSRVQAVACFFPADRLS